MTGLRKYLGALSPSSVRGDAGTNIGRRMRRANAVLLLLPRRLPPVERRRGEGLPRLANRKALRVPRFQPAEP